MKISSTHTELSGRARITCEFRSRSMKTQESINRVKKHEENIKSFKVSNKLFYVFYSAQCEFTWFIFFSVCGADVVRAKLISHCTCVVTTE